jgi:hypothetical protein
MTINYWTASTRTTPSTVLSTLNMYSIGASRNALIYEIDFSNLQPPADLANQLAVQRYTAGVAATASAVTNIAQLNPSVGGAVIASTTVITDQTTVQATGVIAQPLLSISLNQKAGMRWIAAPGSEIVSFGGAGNGTIFNTPVATSTPQGPTVAVFFSE